MTGRDPADDLATLARASGPEREALLEDFLRAHAPVLRRIASLTLRYFGVGERLRHDVESEVWMAALEILREARPDMDRIGSFEAFLTSRSRRAVARMLDSPGLTGVAGTTYLRRKQRSVARSRSRLRQVLGVEPDTDTLLDWHNEQVAARVSDPVRQGAFVTAEDLAATPHTVLAAADADERRADPAPAPELDEVEGRALAGQIVRRCAQVSPMTATVAGQWLAGHLQVPGSGPVSAASVAAGLGLSPPVARRYLEQVRAVALEVATEWGFGV